LIARRAKTSVNIKEPKENPEEELREEPKEVEEVSENLSWKSDNLRRQNV